MSSIVDSPTATGKNRKSKKARKSAPTEATPAPSSLSKKKRKIAHEDATVIEAVAMEVEATVEVESAVEVESSPVKALSKAEKGKDKKKMKEQAKALVSPVATRNIGAMLARYSGGVAAVQKLIREYCVARRIHPPSPSTLEASRAVVIFKSRSVTNLGAVLSSSDAVSPK